MAVFSTKQGQLQGMLEQSSDPDSPGTVKLNWNASSNSGQTSQIKLGLTLNPPTMGFEWYFINW